MNVPKVFQHEIKITKNTIPEISELGVMLTMGLKYKLKFYVENKEINLVVIPTTTVYKGEEKR